MQVCSTVTFLQISAAWWWMADEREDEGSLIDQDVLQRQVTHADPYFSMGSI